LTSSRLQGVDRNTVGRWIQDAHQVGFYHSRVRACQAGVAARKNRHRVLESKRRLGLEDHDDI